METTGKEISIGRREVSLQRIRAAARTYDRQKQLAQELGTTDSTLSKYLNEQLPFQVIEELANARINADKTVHLAYGGVTENKGSRAEAGRVLERIGGVRTGDGSYAFDYYPHKAITEIIVSGCLPDQKAYQFYPTPETVARAAIEAAEIGPRDRCLEPSAGQGGLADHMPKDRTQCVEVSELHCQVLAAKGHSVAREDFLVWNGGPFDRIVMNPPFSDGRWQAHLSHAATLLRPGGRLVAVLPASTRGKPVLPGFSLSWSRDYADEFAGTSISVVLLTADKENT